MKGQENEAELVVMSVVMIVLSAAGIVAGFSRDLFGGIDGLLMLAIALMIFLVFVLLLFFQAKKLGWLGKHHSDETPPAAAK
jgi:uncharacterized membrane protein